jgi:hypothetical protein
MNSTLKQHQNVAELDALQAAVDALKRLPPETAAELDALLTVILQSSPGFDPTGDRTFKRSHLELSLQPLAFSLFPML